MTLAPGLLVETAFNLKTKDAIALNSVAGEHGNNGRRDAFRVWHLDADILVRAGGSKKPYRRCTKAGLQNIKLERYVATVMFDTNLRNYFGNG